MPEAQRPLALLITRNFPPLIGGMEKLNQHLLGALGLTHRIALCGPAGCGAYAPEGAEIRQRKISPLPVFLIMTLWSALILAWRRKPDLVLAGSGLTAPIAWLVARCVGGRAIVYLHGLDIIVPRRIYQLLWLPFIRRCDVLIANSANTAALARSRGPLTGSLHILNPGTDIPVLDRGGVIAALFRDQFGLGRGPILVSVGRLTQRKGLAEFVKGALPMIVKSCPDVILVVIGEEATHALHTRGGSERERIQQAAKQAGVEHAVRFIGACDERTLAAAYQAASVHVFPVLELSGDVEGFGMVALEAAAHGLLTVAFAIGGVPDAVQDGYTGRLCESGDYQAFAQAVIDQVECAEGDAAVHACREFAAGKAWSVFAARLNNLLDVSHDRSQITAK